MGAFVLHVLILAVKKLAQTSGSCGCRLSVALGDPQVQLPLRWYLLRIQKSPPGPF